MAKAASQKEAFPCQEQCKGRYRPDGYPPLSLRSWICCCLVTKLCLTLCNLMDCSLPGSSVHGVFQARTLERVSFLGRKLHSLQGSEHLACILAGFYTTAWPLSKENHPRPAKHMSEASRKFLKPVATLSGFENH